MTGISVKRLKQEARQSAEYRGHNLGTFKQTGNAYYARCKNCDCEVWVTPHPAPNEIDVMGDAVALDCPAKPQEEVVHGNLG